MKPRRGFAAMRPEQRRIIASKGGKTGAGHKWTKEEARIAGSKGGKASKGISAEQVENRRILREQKRRSLLESGVVPPGELCGLCADACPMCKVPYSPEFGTVHAGNCSLSSRVVTCGRKATVVVLDHGGYPLPLCAEHAS